MTTSRSGPAPLRLAAVRIGAADVGIPADAVLQALPATSARPAPPRRRGALCAVVEHEGRLLPVVDLARWVDVGSRPGHAADARIVLLRDGARRVGLRVDAIDGLVDAAAAPARLHRDDDPDEVFHTVARARESGLLLSVLDVALLAALAMSWHEDTDGAADGPAAAAGAAAPDAPQCAIQYAILRCGGLRVAVPAADLAEVLPMPHVDHAGFGLAHCTWRGRHVPVLPAGLPDEAFAAPPAASLAPLLAVIEHGGLALGLPVDAALGMAPFASGHAGVPAHGGIAVAAHDADGAILLLDSARLLARFPEATLSRPGGPLSGAGAGTARRNPTTHIVFEADGLASTPIDAVEEVLPFVQGTGTLAWRGTTITLADLRHTERSTDNAGHVMVVRQGERHTAYVVDRVHLLIPPQGGTLYRLGTGPRAVEFISVGDGAGQASYRTVDLTG